VAGILWLTMEVMDCALGQEEASQEGEEALAEEAPPNAQAQEEESLMLVVEA